jgi:hypothetical protein
MSAGFSVTTCVGSIFHPFSQIIVKNSEHHTSGTAFRIPGTANAKKHNAYTANGATLDSCTLILPLSGSFSVKALMNCGECGREAVTFSVWT